MAPDYAKVYKQFQDWQSTCANLDARGLSAPVDPAMLQPVGQAEDATSGDGEEEEDELDEDYPFPVGSLTSLGLLKYMQVPGWEWIEWKFLQTIHWILTARWYIIQGGMDDYALEEWMALMNLLELDRRARMDLFLLAQSGYFGRALANKTLWEILTGPAIDPPYWDMSHRVTQLVRIARRKFERPPRDHPDLKWWDWSCYGGGQRVQQVLGP